MLSPTHDADTSSPIKNMMHPASNWSGESDFIFINTLKLNECIYCIYSLLNFQQLQNNYKRFIKVGFIEKLLYWITLGCTSVPNKLVNYCASTKPYQCNLFAYSFVKISIVWSCVPFTLFLSRFWMRSVFTEERRKKKVLVHVLYHLLLEEHGKVCCFFC